MTDVEDPSFPKNATQQPNLEYFFPLGGLITQMIVLEASNPLGPTFGEIPAVIFRYYTPETSEIGMATCGNAIYANAYLYPGSRPPPTPVSLRSVFVNPLSAKTPAFLSTFQATCSPKGGGYMGGDPYTSSKYHVLSIFKACFAPGGFVFRVSAAPDASNASGKGPAKQVSRTGGVPLRNFISLAEYASDPVVCCCVVTCECLLSNHITVMQRLVVCYMPGRLHHTAQEPAVLS